MVFYSGLNPSAQLFKNKKSELSIEGFSEVLEDVNEVEIEWNYFLGFKKGELFIFGDFGGGDEVKQLILTGGDKSEFLHALPDKETVTIITSTHKIWQYKVYENKWKEIDNFIPRNDENLQEFVIKIDKNSCIVALTNLGRIFNVPNLFEIPKRVKFVDFACGFNHSIILADNGDVYSMGMGTRGQLGHGDLEDCDEPTLIEALAGLNITQIAAGGWHNAALTNDGDLYTWGWNTSGQLGVESDQNVIALPTVVDFKNNDGIIGNEKMKKVQCGNDFTICLSDEGTLWGSGSNKYGQLGEFRRNLVNTKDFRELKTDFRRKKIVDIKCKEWGSLIKIE